MTINTDFRQSAALSTLNIAGQELKFHRMQWSDVLFTPALGPTFMKKEYIAPFRDLDDMKARLKSPNHAVLYFADPKGSGLPLITLQGRFAHKDKPLKKLETIMQPTAASVSEPDTVVFFSIIDWTNGAGLGRDLIMNAVQHVQETIPSVTNHITFSPMPDFRTWLERQSENILEVPQIRRLENSFFTVKERLLGVKTVEDFEKLTLDPRLCRDQMRLGSHYLLTGTMGQDGKFVPNDRVAKFHPRNGARVTDLHFGGNVSPEGLKESIGLTTSYTYSGEDLAENQRSYKAGIIPRSDAIQAIFDGHVTDKAVAAATHRL